MPRLLEPTERLPNLVPPQMVPPQLADAPMFPPPMRSLVTTSQDWPRIALPVPARPTFGVVSTGGLAGPIPAFLPPGALTLPGPDLAIDVLGEGREVDEEAPAMAAPIEPALGPSFDSYSTFFAVVTFFGLAAATIVILCFAR